MAESAEGERVIDVFIPPGADQSRMLDFCLVSLTEAIAQLAPESVAHGFLGGAYGYGAYWENDVFAMRPYYWGDCDCGADGREEKFWATHKHAKDCYQTELRKAEIDAGIRDQDGYRVSIAHAMKITDRIYRKLCKKFALPRFGCAVHCTCGLAETAKAADISHRPTCSLELPNFLHKQSGFEVRWYKWIGRSMETKGTANVPDVFRECFASLAASQYPPQTPGSTPSDS